MAWLLLLTAGLLEALFAPLLKLSDGFQNIPALLGLALVLVTMMALLQRAFKTIPVSIGYGVWTGIGIVGSALVGVLVFGENLTTAGWLALLLIVAAIAGLKYLTAD